MDIFTIGHSTHSQEEFISLLRDYHIEVLVDVRSYPGSNYVPQFNKENMEIWVPENDIEYIHMKELGGRRKGNKDLDQSLIDGWENQAFRNYAGYTLTPEYEDGINRLIHLGENKTLCYMCSEAVPWRCHRLLISNTLVLRGINVYHIMSEAKTITHELGMYGATPVIEGNKLIYPKYHNKLEEDTNAN